MQRLKEYIRLLLEVENFNTARWFIVYDDNGDLVLGSDGKPYSISLDEYTNVSYSRKAQAFKHLYSQVESYEQRNITNRLMSSADGVWPVESDLEELKSKKRKEAQALQKFFLNK